MKQKFVTFMLALLATTALFAQTKVTGTVTDDIGPVIGASVMEKGTSNGAITDLDGNYVITVKPGATLVFSSIGYATQEIVVGSQTVINVKLSEDAEFLDEVVVVGYGTMKRSDLSGASVSMKEEDLKGSIISSLDQSLQGRAAGVQIQANTGLEARVCVPGHMLRGGAPSAYDRVLSTQFGVHAAYLIAKERYGRTVAKIGNKITSNKLEDIAGKTKFVDTENHLVIAARDIGVSFGD